MNWIVTPNEHYNELLEGFSQVCENYVVCTGSGTTLKYCTCTSTLS